MQKRFLPRFNASFRVEAAQLEATYRAPNLGVILSFRHPHAVARSLPPA